MFRAGSNQLGRKHGLVWVIALAWLTAGSARAQEATPSTGGRNIVFILVDDQRYDAMSLLGHPFLETPHLDALARGGMLLENAFVTTSLCSPSRASILTGQYGHRHRVLNNSSRLDEETPTFPRELQEGGYRTAFIGKWHMGGFSDEPRPGFDRWVSFRGQGVYNNPTFNIDGERVPREGYVSDLITDYAVDFIEGEHEEPFMLYVSHKAVHAGFVPAKRHKDSYAGRRYPHPESMANTDENYRGKPGWVRRQRNSWHGVDGMYAGSVDFDQFVIDYAETMRGVDDSVGRIVESLREEGMLDSTLILFTSDNGFLFGEHALIDKRAMYEESIRVPLIAHCPDLIEAGSRRGEMILNIDFGPTMLEAAGLAPPDSMQGRSFFKMLDGEAIDWRDAFLYEYFWERAFPQTPTVLGVRTDRYKLMRYHGIWDRYELYDLQEDPREKDNLLSEFMVKYEGGSLDNVIRRNAGPELRELFTEMQGKLNAQLRATGAAGEPNWLPFD